ncbi:MAG: TonB-dependent receptor [Bacteroidia bacterium]|nr:TonB-dependent receptor [Bacteroidia bacterium]
MNKLVTTLVVILFWMQAVGQGKTGQISGVVKDKNSQELLVGASVGLEGTTIGALTDADGKFKIQGIPVKSYNIKINYVGYKPATLFNVVITSGNIQTFSIELEPESKALGEVVVKTRKFIKQSETPLSIQSMTTEEIRSNPGGNFDISRVIQALPGVGGNTGGASFRNDIIIRGGGPNENVFYLDGIEIPVINHFTTQGSSGGPQGILNVSFIEDVTLSSSSFGARYDNPLSSVFTFRQKNGNNERLQGNIRLSGSEFGLTMDGPLTKKTTFLASARRSYLQFLFSALDIPIRPNYWDFQYKTTTTINEKTTLTTLGVGAIDEFKFGVPKESSPDKEYAIRSAHLINQWSYTMGAVLKRRINKGYMNISASRNMLNNTQDGFEDAKYDDESRRTLKIRSQEMENKFRIDVNKYLGKWKYAYGGMFQYVKYNNQTLAKIRNAVTDSLGQVIQPARFIDFSSAIEFFKMGAFAEANRKFFDDRLGVNLGVRMDMNTFTKDGMNPLQTLSPRLSLNYALTENWSLNFTTGRYYKIPPYTTLGFRDNTGAFVNKNNSYIRADHIVAGIEFLPAPATRITVEGFFKSYSNYPVSIRNGISLANDGAGFNVFGNEAVESNGKGQAYGFEVFFQQKLTKNIFATVSYTWFKSEFSGRDGKMVPSAWDNRHLVSAIMGYKFKRGWEIGAKYRLAGGSPYSPFNENESRLNYLTTGNGIIDYTALNTLRLKPFTQFDIRIDKKINFKNKTLDIFLDIQNLFAKVNDQYPNYTFRRTADNSGWATTDGQSIKTDGSNAIPILLYNEDAVVLPTFGFILEF